MGRSPAQAILLVFVSCFFTFSVAEWMELSGIIAVLFNSMLMGSHTRPHLNKEEMALASFLLKQMSSLAETLIFLTSGVMAVFVIHDEGQGMWIGFWMCLFCALGRLLAVMPLGVLSNGIKKVVSRRLPKERHHMISWKHLLMMWHAGLRGGVSLVLALELDDWVDETCGKGSKVALVNATFVLVTAYLFVFGSSTGTMLRVLNIPVGDQVPPGKQLYEKTDKHGFGWKMMMYIRVNCLKPILVGKLQDAAASREHTADCDMLRDVIDEANGHRKEHSSTWFTSVFDLFGTTDPTHVDELESVHEEDSSSEDEDDHMAGGYVAGGSSESSAGEGGGLDLQRPATRT